MVLHPQGGYQGSEADVSLTALVLIALDEGKELCHHEIPVRPKKEGNICRAPYPLHPEVSPTLISLSVHPLLLTPRPLSSRSSSPL